VYVVGGYDGEKALAVNEEYTPERDSRREVPWRQQTTIPSGGRYRMAFATVADVIHLVGGENEATLATPLRYYPANDEWLPFESPALDANRRLGAAGLETQVFLVGGDAAAGFSRQNQSYQAMYSIAMPLLR
jgi:hypothetical protein